MTASGRLDLRLALPVGVAWLVLGVVLGTELPLAVVAGGSAVVGIVALVFARGRASVPSMVISLSAGVTALLLASAGAGMGERSPAELQAAADDSRHVAVEATLTQAVVDAEVPARVRATLTSVRLGDDTHSVAVPVTVFATFDRVGEVGDRIDVAGTLAATSPADSSAFLLFARGGAAVTEAASGPVGWAGELRKGFRELAGGLPEPGAGLLPGLAIGDTTGLDARVGEAMRASSLTHLTAVSGANCAIVVGLVLALGALLRMPRWARAAASVAVLVVFVLIVTPEPSVLRASVMAVAVLLARLLGRGAAGVPVLSLAVLLLLAIDPWLARSYGFILSVLATAGLLVLAGPLARRLAHIMPMPIAALIAVPLSAQLACQPVIILLTPSIPVYGVVANLLAGPAAPAATVLGLVACLLQPVMPWLAAPVAWCAWLPSAWIAAVAEFFGSLPGAQLEWQEGALGVAFLSVLTVLGLGVVLASRRRWWALALSAVLVVAGGVVAGDRIRVALDMPADWQLAVCDVGQGDAVVVRDSDTVMLIDTGKEPAPLGECLSTLGISHVDTLVLTHFDLDHVGGVDAVRGRVTTALVGPTGSAEDERMLRALADDGAEVVRAERGLRGSLGSLEWSVLWPARSSSVPPGNDASIVLALSGDACDCLTSVLLGDLGQEAQVRMLALARSDLARLGQVDVVKVSHHGSADQSDSLYQAISASLGVIGVGSDNTYGHPAPSILDTLRATGTVVTRSDRHGLVLVSSAPGGGLSVWRERADTDGLP